MSDPVLIDCAKSKELKNTDWLAVHAKRFTDAAPAYNEYKKFLEEVLKEIRDRLSPLGFYEVRVKTVESYLQKLLYKREKYQAPGPLPPDPLLRVTDLCGGRLICTTSSEASAVCELIEKTFAIDWANSENKSQKLGTSEFGYRSVHYVVQVDANLLKEAHLTPPGPEFVRELNPEVFGEHVAGHGLKAEIQVRTILEHASSTFGHKSIYKSDLKLPDRIHRQHAALAAVLENADREAECLLYGLNVFKSNIGAWHERDHVLQLIENSKILLDLPEAHLKTVEKLPIAIRAAQWAISIGEHEQASGLLVNFAGQDGPHRSAVLRVLGRAMVTQHWLEPNSDGFKNGVINLEQSAPEDAETLCLLAECALLKNELNTARDYFAKAMEVDPTEPLTVARYLEFEAASQCNVNSLRLSRPTICRAIERAERQIEARANLPGAWAALAMLNLFSGKPFEALNAVAHLALLCKPEELARKPHHLPEVARALARLRQSLTHLDDVREKLEGFAWFERMLVLLMAAQMHDQQALDELRNSATKGGNVLNFEPNERIVFFCGGCSPKIQGHIDRIRDTMLRGCNRLSFTLVSGGTRAGISALAGDIASSSQGAIKAIGYIPANLPRGISGDSEHFIIRYSPSGYEFTPMEPLQAWTDLLSAGVDPSTVKVLCYAPGAISRAECAIAMSLGAKVGVVDDPTLPKDRRFDTSTWSSCASLLLLPKDAMTIRAFLQIEDRPMSNDDRVRLARAAQKAHEDYLKSAKPSDPSLQPWDTLSESLKLSNYHQVAYWEKTLREYGLGIRKLGESSSPPPLEDMSQIRPRIPGADPIRELAELEHGRWNLERLSHGWRYAPQKDIDKKLSPWLVSWTELPPDIQQYDVNAIVGLPMKLREIGLELFQLKPRIRSDSGN